MSTNNLWSVYKIIEGVKLAKGFHEDKELSDWLGVSNKVLSAWKSRGKIANYDVFLSRGFSVDWLRTGAGNMFVEDQRENMLEAQSSCPMVDIYNMVEGGVGAEPEWHEPIDRRAIPAGFLKPHIRAVLVRGRSMEPTFKNGAIIGIDQNDRQVIEGEAYAIVLPYSGAAVKRVYPLPDGVLIRSDNKEFPEVKLKREEIPDYFILGRVCWVVQEV